MQSLNLVSLRHYSFRMQGLSVYPSCPLYPLVPAPSVTIERVDDPFNGSVFTLSCIVKVNSSVNTKITISTHWLLPPKAKETETTSSLSERVTELEERRNLTFEPLRSQDSGLYECNATISPEHGGTFVAQNTTTQHYNLTVQSEDTKLT